MIEPIDFSASEGEYLTSDIKQKVLAFSLVWATVGAIFSGWLFLGKKVGPASIILDRRQAEGRVVEASSPGARFRDSGSYSSRAPRVSAYKPPQRSPSEDWSSLARLESSSSQDDSKADESKEESQSRKVRELETTVDLPAVAPSRLPLRRSSSRPTVSPRPSQPTSDIALDRLLYPIVDGRPERSNLSAVSSQAESHLIRLANLEGKYHVGVLLGSSGRALISDSFLNDGSLDRVWLKGRLEKAELVGRDAEYGMALIQLPQGNYGPGLPLSPAPPVRGEKMLAFGPGSNNCVPTTVRAGVGFAAAGFLVEGFLGSATWGSPILNDRGELVGCHFGSLPNFPGSGVHLAADSAAIYRLTRGYKSNDTYAYESTRREAYARLTSLAGETRDEDGTKKGRILAKVGVSQFFIGMSPAEASKWVQSPQRTSVLPGVENWKSPAPPLELVFVNDRLVAVATDFTGFSTVTGLSMGARIDSKTLSRSFDDFMLVDGLALVPGLDILLDRDGKAREFVVRPEL